MIVYDIYNLDIYIAYYHNTNLYIFVDLDY